MFEQLLHLSRLPKKAVGKPTAMVANKNAMILDGAEEDKPDNRLALFQEQQIASEALNYFSEWCETNEEDLEENEGFGDRLLGLMIAVADDNQDGELDDDEQEVVTIGLNAVYDYLISKGVSEENAGALLDDFDNDLARNIHEFILTKLPQGEEEMQGEMDALIFSTEENEAVLDGALADELITDAAYRKVFAIRNGKKMRINKRISGKVRLTAKQRTAIRKAQRRANTGAAKMRRLKSFKMRRRMGL
ncbi:hypothetical protein [Avibacterium paragallinarum]|uniref:Uncharacterized protein n=1 Tax=Avibacterium paragallinarum TaxID=728 RepID=A0AAE5THL7_AVIPA|nr:hypothetical protein [Avibacterium paragallinarum]MEE3608302.1 hypothetical protein [Avibacterium paragallinarum]MEE3620775.1 hypothetical protein [Avibacterium paragallinarum]MEE3668076.1 hypothetical protein [Avibacterium paragallinarum]MEE3681348.1 hypothetical protein [Avibacterium paragallinarum]MEE4385880.1 hypothetical protein [Avibacterium paragallinarum]